MEDFSKWFHSTYEIIGEPKIISLRTIRMAYKCHCVPLYKNTKEYAKHTTYKRLKENIQEYEPEIYNKYFKMGT